MAGERMYPILPCADIDEVVAFYEALGFTRTYLQKRPNPYAVVARDDIQLHLGGIDGFDPSASYGSVIITVPDADVVYADFAAGLRAHFGKLPVAGIPRILRPRKQQGTVRGFSVVDPGGNWLRFSRQGDTEEEAADERSTGLDRVVDNASRQADARGRDTRRSACCAPGSPGTRTRPPDRGCRRCSISPNCSCGPASVPRPPTRCAAPMRSSSRRTSKPTHAASFDHVRQIIADG